MLPECRRAIKTTAVLGSLSKSQSQDCKEQQNVLSFCQSSQRMSENLLQSAGKLMQKMDGGDR